MRGVLVWGACFVTACAGTEYTRYRMPLQGAETDAGWRCVEACNARTELSRAGYFECLEECPGMEVTPDVRCGAGDAPPVAACANRERSSVARPVAVGIVVNVAIAVILYVLAASCVLCWE